MSNIFNKYIIIPGEKQIHAPVFMLMLMWMLCPIQLNSQVADTAVELCAHPKIKTILLHREGWDLSMPVIQMDQKEHLELHFDYLDDTGPACSYSVVSCTYDWQINPVSEHYYLEGFNDVPLDDPEPSRNTTRFYTHYKATIPGEDLKINQSGNFLLRIFPTDDPDNTLLTKRFSLVNPKVEIDGRINRNHPENQEIMLTINLGSLKLLNPLEEIKLVILKNYDWNNQVPVSQKPLLKNNVLDYTLPYQIVAPGGNEFRYANIKDTDYPAEGVEFIEYRSPEYNFILKPDKLKQFMPYFDSDDLNGLSFCEVPDAIDRQLDADYVRVHFRLESPVSLGTDVYIYGALTGWKTDESNYMVYNPEAGVYEANLLVKQGIINYAYATRDYNSEKLNFDITEGNHGETKNEYQVFVYLTSYTGDFDELIGYTIIDSAEAPGK